MLLDNNVYETTNVSFMLKKWQLPVWLSILKPYTIANPKNYLNQSWVAIGLDSC